MSLLVGVKNEYASYFGCEKMGLIIKKRFGPRNFVQYLAYTVAMGTNCKAKEEQQVSIIIKGDTGYIYKHSPAEKAVYDSQQSIDINTTRYGSLNRHFYGGNQDNRS